MIFSPKMFSRLTKISEFMHFLCFPENEPIASSLLWDGCNWFTEYMVGDGGGCGGVALGGHWEGVGRVLGGRCIGKVLGGRLRVVRVG